MSCLCVSPRVLSVLVPLGMPFALAMSSVSPSLYLWLPLPFLPPPTPARLYLHLPLPLCPSSSLPLGRLFLSISVLFSIPLSLSLLLSSQSSPPPSLPLLSPPSPSFLLHSLFVCHSLPSPPSLFLSLSHFKISCDSASITPFQSQMTNHSRLFSTVGDAPPDQDPDSLIWV